LKKLSGMVLGTPSGGSSIISLFSVSTTSAVPADAKSLARLHLKLLSKRIDVALNAKPANGDETVTAHLEECKERIAKVLTASMQSND